MTDYQEDMISCGNNHEHWTLLQTVENLSSDPNVAEWITRTTLWNLIKALNIPQCGVRKHGERGGRPAQLFSAADMRELVHLISQHRGQIWGN